MKYVFSLLRGARTVAVLVAGPASALAQCPDWSPGFGERGTNNPVHALEVLDAGNGPRLFVGGAFGVAGGTRTNFVASFDGATWSAMPGLANSSTGSARALAAFDSGTGTEIYAAGFLTVAGQGASGGIAQWNGTAWTPVQPTIPTSGITRSFAVFDDGQGPKLFAGTTGGVFAWDGASWTTITTTPVLDVAVFDDGSGSALYAGGAFTQISGVPANRVAKWDGTAWSALGGGLAGGTSPRAFCLAVHDFGSGPRLVAGGTFATADALPANHVAAWDGASWSALASGIDGASAEVHALASYDDSGGTALYVGGRFASASGTPARNIARWSGASWSALGGGIAQGVTQTAYGFSDPVTALAVFDSGRGAELVVGGAFTAAGDVDVVNIARWNGATWSPFVDGQGFMDPIRALTVGDDGSGDGPTVFAGGTDFLSFGSSEPSPSRVWKWSGTSWSSIGSANGGVRVLLFFADTPGGCARLYAGGSFTEIGGVAANNIARWNGAAWEALGDGMSGAVNALAVHDFGFGRELVVGGEFSTADTIPAFCIARWNGSTFHSMGAIGGPVYALETFDDGIDPMPALYVGGDFDIVSSNGMPLAAQNIVRWDGSNYHDVGGVTGLNGGSVRALLTWDDGLGAGPALYVAGTISFAGDFGGLCGIARFDGAHWSPLGDGLCPPTPIVRFQALTVFDDGSGEALFAGGGDLYAEDFTGAGGIAKWNGVTWTLLDGGTVDVDEFDHVDLAGVVSALVGFEGRAGDAPSLFAGGRFRFAGDEASSCIARWIACTPVPGVGFCFGDGSLATPCPCAPPNTIPNPSGAPDAGCANSFQLDGAKLFASGSTTRDHVALIGTGLTPSGYTLFFVGTGEIASGVAYGDGVRCTGGALTRFGPQFATCGTVRYPNADLGYTLPLSVVSGTAPGSGQTRWYQGFYRNATASFCSDGTTNFTSGYRITW